MPSCTSSSRTRPGYGEPIRTTFACDQKRLLHVDAYAGSTYQIGSLWRVTAGEGDKFNIAGINKDGSRSKDDRYVRCVSYHDFEIDPSIPDDRQEG